ncbi:hypothetical protein XENOCAPTIV_025900, partial [Xenoophorus captivus]
MEEVDIQAALELIALSRTQDLPYKNIIINGKAYSCLCDTGACRTVLTKPPPGVKYSNTAVHVRSAAGTSEVHYLSAPVTITEPETKLTCQAPVLISQKCPVNLLGRDLMQKLHINIVSTKTGMKAVVEEGALVLNELSQPYYYWSLDLGPTPTARELLRRTREKQTSQEAQYMPDTELHVTMRYKNTAGPDYQYDTVFHRENNQTVNIQHLYVDPKTGKSSTSIILSGKQFQQFKGSTPHLSLTKP